MSRKFVGTVRLVMASAITLGIAASLMVLGTHAGFIAQTTTGGNTFLVGTLKITSLGFNGGSFSVANIVPGLKQSNAITLTNSGTLGATMQLHVGSPTDSAATTGTCDSSNSSFVTSGTTCGQAPLSSSLQLLVFVPSSAGGVCVYPQNGNSFSNGSNAPFTAAEDACGYGALAGSSGFPAAGAPVPFGASGATWPPGDAQAIVFAIQLPLSVQNEVLGTATTVDFSWQSESVAGATPTPAPSQPTATPSQTQATPTPSQSQSTPTPTTLQPTLTFSPTTGSTNTGAVISVSGGGLPENGTYDLYLVNTLTSALQGTFGATATVTSGTLSGNFNTLNLPTGTYYVRALNTTRGGSTVVTSTTTLTITQ